MLLVWGLAAVVGSFLVALAGYLLVEIPAAKAAASAQSNVFLYADGTQLARTGEVNRVKVPLSQVPAGVRHAVLAAEDRDFYHDPAVDVTAMARATWNMLRGQGTQSGSTITQQFVKNYYLNQEQTLSRKIKELVIALKLDQETSKDEILAGYLNTSYFGRGAYGIQAAARAYYGKDTPDLTTAEGAYLASLLNAPSAYDVRTSPENADAARARWEYVLDGMVSEGWLGEERRRELTFPWPDPVKPPADRAGQRGYLVEAVEDHLLASGVVDERELAAGGLRVTTTIEPERQRALTASVADQLLSSLSPGERTADSYVRAGATSVDVDTGHVVAMYGGRDYTEQYVNSATRRDYQAASTFKPFVYAAALQHDVRTSDDDCLIGPQAKYDGTSGREVTDRDGDPTGWAPRNQGDEDYGMITVAEAMDSSVNAVFAQMGADVGAERVRDTAVALGIPAETPGLAEAGGSIALGTATPSTLDLAQAYATLAAHGVHRPAVLVTEVTVNGERLKLPGPDPERALSRRAADGTTALLRGVVAEGSGMAAQSAGRPAAGKTGTAEHDRAAWFAGYTPELATAVAVFGQDPRTGEQRELHGVGGLDRVGGGTFPAQIWGQYTAGALAGEPVRDFALRGRVPDAGHGADGGPDWASFSSPGPGATGTGPAAAPLRPVNGSRPFDPALPPPAAPSADAARAARAARPGASAVAAHPSPGAPPSPGLAPDPAAASPSPPQPQPQPQPQQSPSPSPQPATATAGTGGTPGSGTPSPPPSTGDG